MNKWIPSVLCTLCLVAPPSSLAFEYNGTPAGWALGTSELTTTIQSRISTNWRPTSIDATLPGSQASRFITCYVQNSGTHQQTVMLASNRTSAQLNSLRTNGWRVEDVERVGAGLYTAIMIRDTVTPLSTGFFADLTTAQVTSLLGSNRRLIDLDSVLINGVRKFNGVWKSNTGSAFRPWGWMPDHTLKQIGDWANQNNMRVIDLDPRGGGRFSAVFVRREAGVRYGYVVGPYNTVKHAQESSGTRFQRLKKLEGQNYYAGVLVNNVGPQAARIADQLGNAAGGGRYGAYLRQIGGPVLVDLAGNRDMYPASAIKVLIHIAGLAQVPVNQLDTYIVSSVLLRSRATRMMMNSNNNDTYALNSHFGTDTINQYGRTNLGTTSKTWIASHFGNPPPDENRNANSTLVEMTNLYARRGVLGADRLQRFRNWMINDTNSSFLNAVGPSVRNQLGLTQGQYGNWLSAVRFEMKAGNIGLNGSGTLNQDWVNVGRVSLPFRGNNLTAYRHYVFGHFVNMSVTGYQGGIAHSANLFREQVVESMNTYR